MRKIKIDVWTDVVCPWCLIGSARLDTAIAELPDDVSVEVENHPFYLDPNTPPEGYDVGEMLKSKYGREPSEMWARPQEEWARQRLLVVRLIAQHELTVAQIMRVADVSR